MSSLAVVTGASSGIGASYARLLAAEGHNLVLIARDASRLEALARELSSAHGIEANFFSADLTTESGCAKVEEFLAGNAVDVLINNAGYGLNSAFTKSQISQEQEVLNILVRTPMRLCHTVLPGMRARGHGIVVNVSSVAGFIAGGAYSAMKSYVTVLSESLNAELTGTGVTVSALCPGFTRTEFHQRASMKMDALPNFMWLNADRLVAKSWSDAKRGKAVSVPGWQYRALLLVIRFAPRALVRQAGMNLRRKQR